MIEEELEQAESVDDGFTADGYVPDLKPVSKLHIDSSQIEYTTDFVDKLYALSGYTPSEFTGVINEHPEVKVSNVKTLPLEDDPLYGISKETLKWHSRNHDHILVDPQVALSEEWDNIKWDGFNVEEIFFFLLERKAKVSVVKQYPYGYGLSELEIHDYNYNPVLKFTADPGSYLYTKDGLVAILTEYEVSQYELAANSALLLSWR